ncbi:MAG: hypothetical protein AB1345_03510 [Chloroflexota bacterium]
MSIDAGPPGRYRLAQLDDYSTFKRQHFPWQPPLTLQLRARSSATEILGTWGFGLWNDPFSLSLGFGGGVRRLPSLPNAVWFFFASPPNHLSFRDDVPAHGYLAVTFRSPNIPAPILALGLPILPFLNIPPCARLFRRLASKIIAQATTQLTLDPTQWHTYELDWKTNEVIFSVDGSYVLQTSVVPKSPLGLVIWVDNQYLALPPGGRMGFGTLPTPLEAWIQIENLQVTVPA